MERLSARGAEASFNQAEARARELARKTEALNAKVFGLQACIIAYLGSDTKKLHQRNSWAWA
eukprot:scaffold216629_cov18-Tisochrysis_lutea.AAC.1